MRTIFSTEDVLNFIKKIYNDNNMSVDLVDADTGERTQSDMVSYLDINFYTWKNRMEAFAEQSILNGINPLDAWKLSFENSIGKGEALIEQTDEEIITSQEIDGATKLGKITFMVNSDKIKNLEFYLTYIRNACIGLPIETTNSYGNKITCYITIGTLIYDDSPYMSQLGEVIGCSLNFKLFYMAQAGTYNDVGIQLSLDGENFSNLIITKWSKQNIITTEAVPTANRPDLTGFLGKAISISMSFTFFDFNSTINEALDDMFWGMGAIKIDNTTTDVGNVNIPVYVKITRNQKTYIFKCLIAQFDKNLQNSDFTVSTLSLKGWGKIV